MNSTIKNGIIITVIVILVLVIVYFATAFLMTGEIGNTKAEKESFNDSSNLQKNDVVSSLYDNMIIASDTFKQSNSEYKVIFFSQNEVSDNLKSLISSYDSSSDGIKLYKVNIDETINKSVVSDESNPNAKTFSDLKINDVTLITISNGVISSYITGEDGVVSELK